jgi:hypothetical protein
MSRYLKRFGRTGVVIIALAVVCVIGRAVMTGVPSTVAQSPKGGWLGRLAPDAQIDALDRQLRGFDMAMAEVGYRYTEMYFGAMESNWDYALYTAEKIGVAIENGLERRPKRRPNAEAIFLKGAYPAMLEALKQKSPALFKERFDALRSACNACHVAESMPFIHVGIPTMKQTPLVHN